MGCFGIINILLILLQAACYTTFNISHSTGFQATQERYSFAIDYENNQFLLDGRPFRYVSGSFHYFRAPRQFWRDRLKKIKAAGLNAVSTYVEWSTHQPEINQWNWEGDADLVEFIRMIQEEGLLLLLRPGPYICAERDFGGFPYWLLNVVPKTAKLRTNNREYMERVEIYLDVLFRKIQPYLRGNGGPIIMVQVENEYGSYDACDKQYLNNLLKIFTKYIGDKAVLYTTDGNDYSMLSCGSIPGVYATVDFGTKVDPLEAFATMRRFSPRGPLVNSEFYPGWLTHWNESLQTVPTDLVTTQLEDMLKLNASVNLYMFYGGTNFGFTSGANGGLNEFLPQITSYDYDAPMTEAGDVTPKYMSIRNVLRRFTSRTDIPIPPDSIKELYGRVKLNPVVNLFGREGRRLFGTTSVQSLVHPPTMESLNLSSYLVLYETQLRNSESRNSLLHADVYDRALVYVNKYSHSLVGVLSRSQKKYTLPLHLPRNAKLQILVENQGRLNYGNYISDYKGLQYANVRNATIDTWNCTGFKLQDMSPLKNVPDSPLYEGTLHNGPMILRGYFNVTGIPRDTFLDTSSWGKGVAYINGHNLGRYWPDVGPQITLYVPSVYLRQGSNELIVLELEYVPLISEMFLQNHPNLG